MQTGELPGVAWVDITVSDLARWADEWGAMENEMFQGPLDQRKRWLFSLGVFFVGILAIISVYSLRLNGPPIRSDGVGYYLYLPAIFIHQDLSLQRLATEHFNGQIPAWTGVTLFEGTQNYLIKYPIGEAVLMAPFFLLAGLAAHALGVKVDGFSYPFQIAAALSGLVYAVAGLAILWGILQRRFKQNTILLVLFGLVFGTNFFHYASYDSIFSHIYSFFLFCAFLYLVEQIYSRPSLRNCLAAGAVAGLIIVTRPTNTLWLLFGVLFGVTSIKGLLDRYQFWKSHIKECLLGLVPLLGIVALQLIYWKVITGRFMVYSYRNEHFHFLRPEIVNVLFSAKKGLLFWSPILLAVFPGLFYLKKRAPEFFVSIVLFFPLNVYIISSWYCWWYGGSFGARAFTESLPVFAIGLCSFYEGVRSSFGKRMLRGFIFFSVAYSIWLMAKYWTGVIPFDGVTGDYFLKTFFIIKK